PGQGPDGTGDGPVGVFIDQGEVAGGLGFLGDPVDGNIGVAQVSNAGPEPLGRPPRESHDDVRGPGPVDQIVEVVNPPQDGDRAGERVNGQLTAAPFPLAPGVPGMARVDVADDRKAHPGTLSQAPSQPSTVTPGTDDQDAARVRTAQAQDASGQFEGIV